MPYKFRPEKPLSVELQRCAREQLDQAIGELRDGVAEDPVRAVHNARKAIKKERALLRLARDAMPSDQRQRENAALRDAARRLSGTRDADVMLLTLDNLADRFAGQLEAGTFAAIRQQLEVGRGTHAGGSTVDARAIHELTGVRTRVDDWELRREGWKAIRGGLLRSYTQGRRAFRQACSTRSTEDLHDWRKRVKDLWYHERLLTPSCGPAVGGQAKDAQHLADLLGDDHDLAVLRATLMGAAMAAVPIDVGAVVGLIDHRRAELQEAAIHIGDRIYAENSKDFRRRMRRSWQAGRAAASAVIEQHPAELASATRAPHLG